MATSNSYNFTRTATQVIQNALRKCGILAEGEVANSDQLSDALEDLNLMIKALPARGINLWRYETLTVYTKADTQSYSIGATGDNATFGGYKTQLSAAASTGASTIAVDSDANIVSGDFIGVELSDNTMQWTTVNGVPSSDVVTLTDTLTGDASSGGFVYNYTTIAQRPLRLYDGRILRSGGQESPLAQISKSSYDTLSDKANSGAPSQFYYEPTLDNGTLYTFPIASSRKDRLVFSAQRQIQDLDNITDNLDVPTMWLQAIIYNLADRISLDYSLEETNPQKAAKISMMAREMLEEAESFDIENASVQFVPSDEDYGG